MSFEAAVLVVAFLSGATAAVVGFGIGSLLTPLLGTAVGMSAAVAAVAIPHAVATGIRCWRLRDEISWRVVRGFGLLSAAGGLAGAALHARLGGRGLTLALGGLLLLTASAGLTGWSRRWHPTGFLVPTLGLISGIFGGVAGNQGGLRVAALGTFGLSPLGIVATSTAVGVLVDLARTPVYLWQSGGALLPMAGLVGLATAGVVLGTLTGERLLRRLPEAVFRQVIAIAIGALGIWLVVTAW